LSLLIVDKPTGPTSFAVVKRVRAILGKRREKVGHGGTLDPFASGVLPICMGEGTKVLQFLLAADKSYEAVVRFGVETDTLDVTGQILAQQPVGNLSATAVEGALAGSATVHEVGVQLRKIAREGTTEGSYYVPADYRKLPVLQ